MKPFNITIELGDRPGAGSDSETEPSPTWKYAKTDVQKIRKMSVNKSAKPVTLVSIYGPQYELLLPCKQGLVLHGHRSNFLDKYTLRYFIFVSSKTKNQNNQHNT